ncbi:acidic leucine-rich nuclear phosphoprotein 32 family member A [Tanacetum coccineum]
MDIQLQINKVFKRLPGKHPDIAKKNPKPNRNIELNWSKRSIFWDLEYWPFLLLKHNLDVMHIEKNALEALLNTLLDNDKSKDTIKARQDLETLRVRKDEFQHSVYDGNRCIMVNSKKFCSSANIAHRKKWTPHQLMKDKAILNEDNAIFINNEDDVVAHVLDDDDVVVPDDDEVNPSTNVEEMACLAPRSHGGDAGGSPPRQPNRPVPAQCQSSSLRIETGNASLRKAFRHNNQQPLTLGFDVDDLGTFHPIGDYASMLNSLMGETIRPLPLACEWEEIPEAFKAHIFPTLESYFNLAEWYNNQDKVVVGKNVYTVGERVRLGLQLKLRLLWRKNKNRIKAQQYTIYDSPDEAKNHLPPSTVWGERTHDEWNELVDWFSHPNQVSRSMKNAANRAKNTIPTHQGKKSFAQGRNEYKVEKGHHEDLIQTWKKTHSNSKTGQFKYEENKQRYLKMKAMQDQIRVGIIPYKTDQEIMDEVIPSDNRQNMLGMGRKLPEQENELLRKQAEEAQQRAYLAALKADAANQRASAAYQNTETMYGTVGPPYYTDPPHYTRPLQPLQRPYTGPFPFTPVTNNTFNNCYRPTINSNLASSSYPQNELPRYITNPHMNDARSIEQLAQDNAHGEDNNESASGEDEEGEEGEEGEQHSSDGGYSLEFE